MECSCVLDLAKNGGMTLDDIGEVMNITRERARQIEAMALDKFYLECLYWELPILPDWLPI
jgi:hypothetical protein